MGLARDTENLWVLAQGAESINVLLKLDAGTGAEAGRKEFPGSVIGVGDGAVWGAGLEREGARTVSTLFRVDARTFEISAPTSLVTTFLPEHGPQEFTQLGPVMAAEGDVWVGSADGIVYRADAESGRVLGSLRTQGYPVALLRRGNLLWTAHLEGRIVQTELEPPVDSFAHPQDAPNYVEPRSGPAAPRAQGFDRVELLGDDRTMVVHFLGGACDHLDHVDIVYEQTRVIVTVMIADDPIPSGYACPGIGIGRLTVAQLREPLGNRTIANR